MLVSNMSSKDPDGRGKLIAVWSVILIVSIALTWYFLNSADSGAEAIEEDFSVNFENKVDLLENPDNVTVTSSDNQYHESDCDWIGSQHKRMSREKAIEAEYDPCPYCIDEEF